MQNTHNSTPREALRRRWELVAFPVAERRRATRRIPEGPVQRTREFRRVRHERAAVPVPVVNERALDRLDTTVHHVARGDAVRAGTRVRESDLRNARGRGRVVDSAVGPEEATMTVGGVLAETDVAGDVELRKERAELAHGQDDGSVGVVCRATAVIL